MSAPPAEWLHHLADEADAAFLYRELAQAEPDGTRAELYRKLARVGSYGAFFPYYICGVAFRASDLTGRTVQFPWIRQDTGRCAQH